MASRLCRALMILIMLSPYFAQAQSDLNTDKNIVDKPSANAANAANSSTSACYSDKTATPELDNCKLWRIKSSDGNVRGLVARWSKEINWQSPVWEVSQDIPIDADGEIRGNFESALGVLAESLLRSETPIQFTLYSNRVLRVEPYINTSSLGQPRIEAR